MPQVIDPLGGSWYVESLTNQIEAKVFELLAKVDAMGGTIKAIEEGWFQREIADSAYETARRRASGEQPLIGVNMFAEPPAPVPVPIHKVAADVEARQVARVKAVRARRDGARVAALLERLAAEARDPAVNLMPVTIELVQGARDHGRDRGPPARGLRPLRRDAHLLRSRRHARAPSVHVVAVPEADLADLRDRLGRTRFPDEPPGRGLELRRRPRLREGARRLLARALRLARAGRRELNRFRQFVAAGGGHRPPLHP